MNKMILGSMPHTIIYFGKAQYDNYSHAMVKLKIPVQITFRPYFPSSYPMQSSLRSCVSSATKLITCLVTMFVTFSSKDSITH
ncbi:hypothetical protein FKM82_006977 [Ascaphus truei]